MFSRDKRFVYSTNELDGTVSTYGYDAAHGRLTLQGTESALPDGFATSDNWPLPTCT